MMGEFYPSNKMPEFARKLRFERNQYVDNIVPQKCQRLKSLYRQICR